MLNQFMTTWLVYIWSFSSHGFHFARPPEDSDKELWPPSCCIPKSVVFLGYKQKILEVWSLLIFAGVGLGRNGWWGGGGSLRNPPNELTVHVSNTWSVKHLTTVILLGKKKPSLPLVNVKILSPAPFQYKVCGSSGEMAAGTDHIQDVVNIHQQLGDNQRPQNK